MMGDMMLNYAKLLDLGISWVYIQVYIMATTLFLRDLHTDIETWEIFNRRKRGSKDVLLTETPKGNRVLICFNMFYLF